MIQQVFHTHVFGCTQWCIISGMKPKILIATILLFPAVSHAQTLHNLLKNLGTFFNSTVIPFLIGIAFLIFVINVFRFFILQGHNQEGREKAKNLAIYSITAFVLIIIFWGIVNLIASSFGLDGCDPVQADFIPDGYSSPCGDGWDGYEGDGNINPEVPFTV